MSKEGKDVSTIEFEVGTDADKGTVDSLISELRKIVGVKVEEPRRAIPEALVMIGIIFTIISGTNALLEIIRKLSDFAEKGNKQVTIFIKNHPIIIGYANYEEIRDVIINYNKESTSSNDERKVKLNTRQKADCVVNFGRKKAIELIQAIENGEIPSGNVSKEFRKALIEKNKEIEQMNFETTRVET
ncbi:hypothetical protein MUP77_09010 [Candidatus Bathyarchaeota archaeon]|nr:hypothetical protein [Candidatus Bathyarchaeota archaeon]